MKISKRIFAAGAVSLCMAASMMAGCGKPDGTKTAITVNDENVNLGTAAFYLNYQVAEENQWLSAYGITWDQVYATATSSTEAQTFGDSLKSTTKDNLVSAVVVNQHAGDYGVTIPDELQSSINDTAEYTYEHNKDAMDDMGTTEDDIKHCLELSTIQRLMYDPITADAKITVTDKEAAECTVTYARTALTTTDTSTYTQTEKTDDEKQQLKDELQELLQMAQQSDDPASFDMQTAANDLDSTNIGCSTSSYNDDNATLPDKVLEAAKGLSDGEIYDGIIDTGDYYYIVRMDKTYDEDASASNKETLISQQKQDFYNDTVNGWVKDSNVKTEKAWDSLSVTDKHAYSVKTSSEGAVSSSYYSGSSSESSVAASSAS
ncbi:MAG: hypothetical protein SOH80_02665 [Eubacteriales bacterium]|jgi:foldase protein PrsA